MSPLCADRSSCCLTRSESTFPVPLGGALAGLRSPGQRSSKATQVAHSTVARLGTLRAQSLARPAGRTRPTVDLSAISGNLCSRETPGPWEGRERTDFLAYLPSSRASGHSNHLVSPLAIENLSHSPSCLGRSRCCYRKCIPRGDTSKAEVAEERYGS